MNCIICLLNKWINNHAGYRVSYGVACSSNRKIQGGHGYCKAQDRAAYGVSCLFTKYQLTRRIKYEYEEQSASTDEKHSGKYMMYINWERKRGLFQWISRVLDWIDEEADQ